MGWTPTPEQRAALIRAHVLASAMRERGIGWTAIAERLTADGYPTMNGAPWAYKHVQRLLKNGPPVERPTKYTTRHWRIRDRRGPAKLLKCVDCAAEGVDKHAYDWSHRHGTDPEDVMNYDPRCRRHHIAYDGSGHRQPHSEAAKAKMSKTERNQYAAGERVGANKHNSEKTHCPANHEYDEANTYIAPDGSRHCITCSRERTREWREAKKREERRGGDAA